nr:ATP synthase 8 [Lepidophthirus macrorhini]
MPQMSPMWWLTAEFIFMVNFVVVLTNIHFILPSLIRSDMSSGKLALSSSKLSVQSISMHFND